MVRYVKLLMRMVRFALAWEWAYCAVMIALALVAIFYVQIGLPRLLASFLIVPVLAMGVGAFFIFDNLRHRAERGY
jgi:hypothetical protein